MELTPITDFDFLQKLKGCGIKYYSKIPRTQLKALLGFCPTTKTKRKIEIESKIYAVPSQQLPHVLCGAGA